MADPPSRKPPDKPVYLLTGSDRPKIDGALVRLREHFAPEATDLRSALDTSADEAIGLCNAGSLFGDTRLVIVEAVDGRRDSDGRLKGGWKASDVERIVSYVADPSPETVLALVGEEVKKSSALYKACAKAGAVLEYSVDKNKLQGWVAAQFAERGVRAEPEACAMLVQIVGNDMHALALEVDKLATWAGEEPIGEREVEELATPSGDAPTFELTDAWAARDSARALEASEKSFERDPKTRRETAPRLAAALGSHVTRLRALKRLGEEGVRPREAAGKLRMHPFYAEKLARQAEAFSRDELSSAVVRIASLDGALKGQSKLPPDLEVQSAVVDLMRAPGSQTPGPRPS